MTTAVGEVVVLPAQTTLVQECTVEQGRVPFCAVFTRRNSAIFQSRIVVGKRIGAGAGLILGEVGLIREANVLTATIREVVLLPAETTFVESCAVHEDRVPFCAVFALRNGAVLECRVVVR